MYFANEPSKHLQLDVILLVERNFFGKDPSAWVNAKASRSPALAVGCLYTESRVKGQGLQ
jgi:hypothetical protein